MKQVLDDAGTFKVINIDAFGFLMGKGYVPVSTNEYKDVLMQCTVVGSSCCAETPNTSRIKKL